MACRMSLAAVVVAVFLSSTVHAQVFFRGNCPKTPVIMDFNLDKYLGRWFEQERYFVAYQAVGRCWTGTYLRSGQYGKLSVRLDYRDVLFQRPKQITVDVTQKDPYEPNRFTYTIPGVPVFEDHYEVLATDYNNWTLEYSCSNKPPFGHTRMVWILTRSPHPEEYVIRVAKERLTKLGIDVSLLRKQDTSCFV